MRKVVEACVAWCLTLSCLASLTACTPGRATPGEQQPADEEASGELLADTTLARLLERIQPAVERSSGMTASRPLNVAATDEHRLRTYLVTQLKRSLSEEEATALTAVYARLGLVPPDLDLRALLTDLLQEQVIGYYDPVSDTLFVHERVTPEELEPVLAHELVHALQDQVVDLDSLGASFDGRSDAAAAYQAAVEGHATFAMMEWAMGGGEADLTRFPDLGPALADIDLSDLGEFGSAEVLAAAPAVIREGLLFPYVGGLVFLQRLWKQRPDRPLPFGAGLPKSTEQIMHVDRWLTRDEPTLVRFTEGTTDGWREVYARDLGEFETRLFLNEHLHDSTRADTAAAGWDGDAYRLLRHGDDEVFVWVSVWDSPEDAREFASAVTAAYRARYPAGDRVPAVTLTAATATVTIVDAPADTDIPQALTRFTLSTGQDG